MVITIFLVTPQVPTHLDTCARLQFAQTADEWPATRWDVGDFGDGLHPLRTSNAHLQFSKTFSTICDLQILNCSERSKCFRIYLWDPKSTADMSPLGACTCGFHGTALLGTQKALRVDAKDASPAQPVSDRHFDYAIAGLWGEQQVTLVTNVLLVCSLSNDSIKERRNSIWIQFI